MTRSHALDMLGMNGELSLYMVPFLFTMDVIEIIWTVLISAFLCWNQLNA
jgi:hypothetical protein